MTKNINGIITKKCKTVKCGKCGRDYCKGCFPKGCPQCVYHIPKVDSLLSKKYIGEKQEG